MNAYWSPTYWSDQKEMVGLGLYWNGASWISGNFSTQAGMALINYNDNSEESTTNSTVDSTYGFINKDGPREYAYSFTQGGFHIYKQTNQTNQTVA